MDDDKEFVEWVNQNNWLTFDEWKILRETQREREKPKYSSLTKEQFCLLFPDLDDLEWVG